MKHLLQDFRLHGIVFCLVAFFAGKFSLTRFLPIDAGIPPWMLEVRFPAILCALIAALLSWFIRHERPIANKTYWCVFGAVAAFTAAYLYFPFPLNHLSDITFGIANVLLFAWLMHPRLLPYLNGIFVALSSALIVVSFAVMPFTDGFVFAGNSATFVKIVAVSLFLLLIQNGRLIQSGLLALHVIAIIYSMQLSGFIVLLFALALMPILLVTKQLAWRGFAINTVTLVMALFIGLGGTQSLIGGKIAFRMKQAEVQQVIDANGKTESLAFPGGLFKQTLIRNGQEHTILAPNFEKDTRVCVDDRSDRFKLFATALFMHSQVPDRWGWGDDVFSMSLTRYGMISEHRHPHNIFLEVLVTRGTYFLLAFLALGYACVIASFVGLYRAPAAIPFAAGMAYILAASQWSGDFFDFRWFFMLMVPVMASGFGITRKPDL
jgi:hypothetical protein